MTDDLPLVEMTPVLAVKQAELSALAALAGWYYRELRRWDLPEAICGDLVGGWQRDYCGLVLYAVEP